MYKQDLALNNPHVVMCHKTQTKIPEIYLKQIFLNTFQQQSLNLVEFIYK